MTTRCFRPLVLVLLAICMVACSSTAAQRKPPEDTAGITEQDVGDNQERDTGSGDRALQVPEAIGPPAPPAGMPPGAVSEPGDRPPRRIKWRDSPGSGPD